MDDGNNEDGDRKSVLNLPENDTRFTNSCEHGKRSIAAVKHVSSMSSES